MQLFFDPDIHGDQHILKEEESKHLVRVLRKQSGDQIQVVDGKGGLYHCTILDAHQKHCALQIDTTLQAYEARAFQLHLAVAPTKNIDRYEWFLEKATEIGIDQITPLLADRSERKVIKPERLQKVLVSAMKQSVQAYLPKLDELTKFKAFLDQEVTGQKFIAHCEAGEKPHLQAVLKANEKATVLIGPEGDFSPAEIELALQRGYQPISLGKNRLRTETAALVAVQTANLINER